MCTSAHSQSMPGRPSWHRSAKNVCASALPCRREPVGCRAPSGTRSGSCPPPPRSRAARRQLDGAVRRERREQRQLRPVDVPHGRDVERERPVGRPERALVRREARLDERVVERRRRRRSGCSLDGVVDPDLARGASATSSSVAARRAAKLDGPGAAVARRGSPAPGRRPRSEKPNRSSTTCPGSVGPAHISPNGRSVVGRIWSNSSRVPPGMSRRSYQSICRHRGASHSMWTASGAPSTTISPCAIPGPIECRCARSGTVRPCGMARPPSEKSIDQPRVAVARERVPVHRALRPDGDLARGCRTSSVAA